MISHRQVSEYITAEPFRPFRITLSSGRSFDIRHPEMVAIGRNTLFVFTSMGNESDGYTERQVQVSLLLTESVEPLDTAPAAQQGAA
jgi:hypothetical protein